MVPQLYRNTVAFVFCETEFRDTSEEWICKSTKESGSYLTELCYTLEGNNIEFAFMADEHINRVVCLCGLHVVQYTYAIRMESL
jgi:hypothetical protein